MTEFTRADAAACRRLVELSLAEDLGTVGDRTSDALIEPQRTGQASFVVRSPGVLAGVPAALLVVAAVNESVTVESLAIDGCTLVRGRVIAKLRGPLRSILAIERTALNFMQRLSGVATETRKYVDAIAGTKAVILDTRKTTPGWRLLEKYAVRCGGGTNHRFGLYDGILIKDNHIAGLGDPATATRRAVEMARTHPVCHGLQIEIEVDTFEQLDQVLPQSPDIVLLDNFSPDGIRQAVSRRDKLSPMTLLEASGGVNLGNVREIAETGVDRISVGALTHSAPALDIGLDFDAY